MVVYVEGLEDKNADVRCAACIALQMLRVRNQTHNGEGMWIGVLCWSQRIFFLSPRHGIRMPDQTPTEMIDFKKGSHL